MMMNQYRRGLLAWSALILVAACGGGGGTTPAAAPASPVAALPSKAASLSGSIVKGPVVGAQVCVYVLASTGKGKLLSCTASNADGSYALNLEFEGEVVVEATGGTYTDEATGLPGISLGAPLQSVTTLGSGANVLHATPLTALAFSRAVAAGGLNQAGFQAKADVVRSAFGLPAEVDLARTLPAVATGSSNAYGTALVGLSKMLGMGATLGGIIGNPDLDALKASFKSVEQCVPPSQVGSPGGSGTPVGQGLIQLTSESLASGGLLVSVVNPTASWRSLLPATGNAMGCELTGSASGLVTMACPAAVLQTAVTALAGTYAQNAPAPSLPSSGLLLMGERINMSGHLNFGGNLTLKGDQVETGSWTVSAVGNLILDSPNFNASGIGTPIAGDLCSQMIGLTPAGIPKSGGIVTPAGTIGGSVTLSGAATLVAVNGGSLSNQGGTLTAGGAVVQAGSLKPSAGSVVVVK